MAGYQSRIVGTGEESPDQLLANEKNWRIHPQFQQEAVNAVLEEVGWVQAVIVNRRTGRLVDGHLRVMLAMRRGEGTIPVTYVDLSEREEGLVLATLDPLAGLAWTDRAKLGELLEDIEVSDESLSLLLSDLRGAGELQEPPSLDSLKEQYGDGGGSAELWQEIRIRVPTDVYERYLRLSDGLPGADEATRFGQLLSLAESA